MKLSLVGALIFSVIFLTGCTNSPVKPQESVAFHEKTIDLDGNFIVYETYQR